MAMTPTRVLTIGCSCINRFQFDFFQERHPGTEPHFIRSLFDWNIVSLIGTEAILRAAASGHLLKSLQDVSQYHVAWDVLLFHKQLPGVCFFHEQEIAKQFDDPTQQQTLVSKLTHQAAPFVNPDHTARTHLVWSNVQPNLPDTVDNVTPWDDFQLTVPRYAEITSLARKVFGPETTFSFLSHADDVAPDLTTTDDVQIVNLPRSDDYQGPPDLYEALLSDTVLRTQT